jgi:hypothetical protein
MPLSAAAKKKCIGCGEDIRASNFSRHLKSCTAYGNKQRASQPLLFFGEQVHGGAPHVPSVNDCEDEIEQFGEEAAGGADVDAARAKRPRAGVNRPYTLHLRTSGAEGTLRDQPSTSGAGGRELFAQLGASDARRNAHREHPNEGVAGNRAHKLACAAETLRAARALLPMLSLLADERSDSPPRPSNLDEAELTSAGYSSGDARSQIAGLIYQMAHLAVQLRKLPAQVASSLPTALEKHEAERRARDDVARGTTWRVLRLHSRQESISAALCRT